MKNQNTRIRSKATAPAVAGQAPTRTERPPAEFKIVRLRECPVDSTVMDNPDAVEMFWRKHVVSAPWFSADKECLVVFLLNTRRYVLGFEMLSQGTKDTLLVNTAEVFRLAAMRNAAAIIIAHNHPSGDPSPSEADIKVTRDIIRAGALLKIEVLDHVVIGRADGQTGRASLRELDLFYDYEQVSGYTYAQPAAEQSPDGAAPGTQARIVSAVLPSNDSPAASNQSPTSGNKASGVFRRMELEVQQALAVLEFFGNKMELLKNDVSGEKPPRTEATAAGYRALAIGAADELFRHWNSACEDANQITMGPGSMGWPAVSNLAHCVGVAEMLMERFGDDLEDRAGDDDKWLAEKEGREPGGCFGYITLGRQRAAALRREFALAWDEWDALEKADAQRAAA